MRKNRILVIDDDAHATRMTRLVLERTGRYEVRELNESDQALGAAWEFGPDLILLDVCMPNVEGSEVAEKFTHDPALASTPIVFLTCIVTPSEAGRNGSVVIGSHEYLAKPVRPEKLLRCIEGNLARASRLSPSAEYASPSRQPRA
ncbi:MAG: response regulator [Verrucomicrobiia bacterium]